MIASIFTKLAKNMASEDIAGIWNTLIDNIRTYCFEENVDMFSFSPWDVMCFIAQATDDYRSLKAIA
jgi:hypothetical protein